MNKRHRNVFTLATERSSLSKTLQSQQDSIRAVLTQLTRRCFRRASNQRAAFNHYPHESNLSWPEQQNPTLGLHRSPAVLASRNKELPTVTVETKHNFRDLKNAGITRLPSFMRLWEIFKRDISKNGHSARKCVKYSKCTCFYSIYGRQFSIVILFFDLVKYLNLHEDL